MGYNRGDLKVVKEYAIYSVKKLNLNLNFKNIEFDVNWIIMIIKIWHFNAKDSIIITIIDSRTILEFEFEPNSK